MQSGPAQNSAGPNSDSDGWAAVSSESDPADDPTDQADLFQSQGKGAQANAS